jgi:hypothetical protein
MAIGQTEAADRCSNLWCNKWRGNYFFLRWYPNYSNEGLSLHLSFNSVSIRVAKFAQFQVRSASVKSCNHGDRSKWCLEYVGGDNKCSQRAWTHQQRCRTSFEDCIAVPPARGTKLLQQAEVSHWICARIGIRLRQCLLKCGMRTTMVRERIAKGTRQKKKLSAVRWTLKKILRIR